MMNDDRDDVFEGYGEYDDGQQAMFYEEQEQEALDKLNAVLRAARDGTIFDVTQGEDDSRVEVNR